MTGNDLLNLPETKWLVTGLIPLGHISLIVGQPGAGKSAIVQWMAKCLANNEPWLNEISLNCICKTLWIDADGAKTILAERLRCWEMNPDELIIPFQKEIYLDFELTSENIYKVETIIQEFSIKLVVIDSLTGINTKREKDSKEMKEVLDIFQTWAQKFQCSVVVIHHLNKENLNFKRDRIVIDRVRGSTQIVASAKSVLAVDQNAIKKTDKEKSNRLYQIKTNLGPQNDDLNIL